MTSRRIGPQLAVDHKYSQVTQISQKAGMVGDTPLAVHPGYPKSLSLNYLGETFLSYEAYRKQHACT